MVQPSESSILQALASYVVPYLQCDLVTAKAVSHLQVQGQTVTVAIRLGFPLNIPTQKSFVAAIQHAILQVPGVKTVDVQLTWKIASHGAGILRVSNLIAVASGKGGVGKSTTAVNVAVALAEEGARVGLLDADIYGPNQPQMLGIHEKPAIGPDKKFIPIARHGIVSMSMGYLVTAETPMIWRGPMMSSALQQLLQETAWGDLDYLIIDLPPGTGDIPLTLAKKFRLSGAVIVTTPQTIALLDVQKGIEMFRKVQVPILGLIENMVHYTCAQCGHTEAIFGMGGGERMAQTYAVPLLGQLPLMTEIRAEADRGVPFVVSQPDSQVASTYRDITRNLAARLSLQPIRHESKFPKVVVET
ncbi:MAG: ATPase [Coxiella sp. RIFCSPHIGHO2_12_FULL_44_14]|nr:MAG: ATPase [Coxiella sp. RIFCSPHIGHO2_12_FULL_44_14]